MACASIYDVIGATSQSCKVTRAIRNIHDQLKSLCCRPAIVKLFRPVEFKSIRSLELLTPGTSDLIPAASSSPELFWPFMFGRLTVFLFEFWPRTFTTKLRKKPTRSGIMILECSYKLERLAFNCSLFEMFLWTLQRILCHFSLAS